MGVYSCRLVHQLAYIKLSTCVTATCRQIYFGRLKMQLHCAMLSFLWPLALASQTVFTDEELLRQLRRRRIGGGEDRREAPENSRVLNVGLLEYKPFVFIKGKDYLHPYGYNIEILHIFRQVDQGWWELSVEVASVEIKIRQFNFELNFNGSICKGNALSQCSLQCALGIYGLTRSVLNNNWTLKVNRNHSIGTIIPIRR